MSDTMFGLLMLPIALVVIAWVLRARVRTLMWWLGAIRNAAERERGKWSPGGDKGRR